MIENLGTAAAAVEVAKAASHIYKMTKSQQVRCNPIIMTVLSSIRPILYRRQLKEGALSSESFCFQGETYNIGNKPLHFHRPHLLYKPHKNFKTKIRFWWQYISQKPLQLERWRHLVSHNCNSSWDSDKIQFAPSENEANIKHLATGESVFYLENKSGSSYSAKESFVFRQEDKLFWGLYISRKAMNEIVNSKAKISFNTMNPQWPLLFLDWKYLKSVSKKHLKNGKQLSSSK